MESRRWKGEDVDDVEFGDRVGSNRVERRVFAPQSNLLLFQFFLFFSLHHKVSYFSILYQTSSLPSLPTTPTTCLWVNKEWMFTSFNFPSFFPPLLVSSLLISFARLTSSLLSISLPILHRPTLLMPLPLTLVHCQSNKWKLLLLKRLSVLPSRSLQSLTKRSRWTMVTTVSFQLLRIRFERERKRECIVTQHSLLLRSSYPTPLLSSSFSNSPTSRSRCLQGEFHKFHLSTSLPSQDFSTFLILDQLTNPASSSHFFPPSSYSTRLQTMVPLRTPSESLSKLVTVTSTLVSNSEELVRN